MQGVALGPGEATGPALILDEPLSFWGGVDPTSGEIIDRHHPQAGTRITGVVLAMRHGRGSSTTPSVLAESVRLGTGPAAVVLADADPMLAVASVVIRELYPHLSCPVVALADDFDRLADGLPTTVSADGTLTQRR